MDPYVEQLWPGGLEVWKSRYPDGCFIEGINVYEGKIYRAPKNYPGGYSALLFYNKSLFKQAGPDPEKGPVTWSQLREHAKKITAAGQGKTFGLIEGGKQLNRWARSIGALSRTAGGIHWDGINYETGRYEYGSDAVVSAIDILKSISDDGSYYAGYMAIDAREARAHFGLGQAGFLFQEQWCCGVWAKDNPDLDFGVVYPPVPDSGRKGYVYGSPIAAFGDPIQLYAKSKHPLEAAELKLYRSTEQWLLGYVKSGDGFSPLTQLNAKENIPLSQMYDIFTMGVDQMRVPPYPAIRNPAGVAAVAGELKAAHPNMQEIVQGAMTGQVTDYRAALGTLTEQMNAELDRSIKAVQAKGGKISQGDYVFPNWDPNEHYLQPDYDALK